MSEVALKVISTDPSGRVVELSYWDKEVTGPTTWREVRLQGAGDTPKWDEKPYNKWLYERPARHGVVSRAPEGF